MNLSHQGKKSNIRNPHITVSIVVKIQFYDKKYAPKPGLRYYYINAKTP